MSYSMQLQRLVRAGAATAAVGVAFGGAAAVASASPVDLGTASPFVVLGGATVTNTGPSVLNGALGVSPGSALTGFNSATVNGATHDNDTVAAQAQSDVTNAYGVAAGQPVTADLSGSDLGGLTLTAGAYHFSSAAQLTGTLTLDAENDPAAQFVIQVGSALTTATSSSVSLVRGASPCHVFWQIGTSATLGTSTSFMGNVLAAASISLNDSATVQGRLFARSGQVSLINNVIDGSMCGTSTSPPPVSPPPTPTPPTSGTGSGSGSLDSARERDDRRHPQRHGGLEAQLTAPAHRTAVLHGRLHGHDHRPADQERRLPTRRPDRPRLDQGALQVVRARRPRRAPRDRAGDIQGRDPRQDTEARLSRLRRGRAAADLRTVAFHRMNPVALSRCRGRVVLALATLVPVLGVIDAAPARAAVPAQQRLVVLLQAHVARATPETDGRRIESVSARRPLTHVRTVLPVVGHAGGGWVQVLLPGRPNGHRGWIRTYRTRPSSTRWQLRVDLSARRVTVYNAGVVQRRFSAVVGKPSTPTPRGRFFVEEALRLSPSAGGGPYALAISARSNVLQDFDGGPGQIALHGMRHLAGKPGSAASHGCIRLGDTAIRWLASRIGSGVPVTVTR